MRARVKEVRGGVSFRFWLGGIWLKRGFRVGGFIILVGGGRRVVLLFGGFVFFFSNYRRLEFLLLWGYCRFLCDLRISGFV